MTVKHVRVESPLAQRLTAVRRAVEEMHPGLTVSDASLIREAIEA